MTPLAISRPRLVCVKRHVPEKVSAGDCATAEVNGGLISLLRHTETGPGQPLGCGYPAEWMVPFGLSVSAALGIVQPRTAEGIDWVGRAAEVEWSDPPERGESCWALATLTSIRESWANFTVQAKTARGSLILKGTLTMFAKREGRFSRGALSALARNTTPVPPSPRKEAATERESSPFSLPPLPFQDAPEPEMPRLFEMRPPRILESDGTDTRLEFAPDLTKFLMNPVAGHPEPIGRRMHPLGCISLGACLTTALAATGEPFPWAGENARLVTSSIEWVSPLAYENWLVTLCHPLAAAGNIQNFTVSVGDENGRLMAEARVGTARRSTDTKKSLWRALWPKKGG